MHAILLALLALANGSETPVPTQRSDWKMADREPTSEVLLEDAFVPWAKYSGSTPPLPGTLGPLPAPTCWPWLRVRRPILPRYPANHRYYQSHSYDPRLMLDYPWHAPRVRQSPYPAPLLGPGF